MPKNKVYSDAAILSALLKHDTAVSAANAIGCKVSTIHSRMKDPTFVKMLEDARKEVIQGAIYDLSRKLTAANAALYEIVSDEKQQPFARIQAAQAIYSSLEKLKRLDSGAAAPSAMAISISNTQDDPFTQSIMNFINGQAQGDNEDNAHSDLNA